MASSVKMPMCARSSPTHHYISTTISQPPSHTTSQQPSLNHLPHTTSQQPSPHLSTSPVLADTQHNIDLSKRYHPAATRQYARAPTPMAVQRWHIVSPSVSVHESKNRGRSMRWLNPQSAHLWWLAVAKLQAASVPIA